MPTFKKSDSALEGALFVETPAGSVVLVADETVEVEEAVASELRFVPSVSEVAEDITVEPAAEDKKPAAAKTKESK
jgi:hypothetical protein